MGAQYATDIQMYSVARLQQQTHVDYGFKFFLNKQWLENLKLEMPTTLDELTDVLRAFRDQDANGNGDPSDEIPLTGSNASSNLNPLFFLMGGFTFVNPRDYFQVKDGILTPAFTTEGWRKGLAYFRDMYKENLIDPLLFTQDLNQLKAIMQTEDDIIAGCSAAMNGSHLFGAHENLLQYIGTGPFAGPDGTAYVPYQTYSLTHNGFITKDCADPVLAFKLLDLTWDKEASMVIRYGEQGVDWEWAPEGTPGMFDSSGMPATFKLLTPEIQTGVQNKWWNVWSPMYLDYTIGDGWADDGNPLNTSRLAYDAIARMKGHIPEEIAGKISYTADESNQIAEIKSNITSYWHEAMTLFVIGDMDIDTEWDAYLAELNDLGLKEYMAVAQEAYTRTWGK
jgi:putative aldouronate transport system substrate-binding protein